MRLLELFFHRGKGRELFPPNIENLQGSIYYAILEAEGVEVGVEGHLPPHRLLGRELALVDANLHELFGRADNGVGDLGLFVAGLAVGSERHDAGID